MRRATIRVALALASVAVGGVMGSGVASANTVANDALANAARVPTLPFSQTLSTRGASTESGENDNVCAPIGATVWFRYDATSRRDFTVDTSGSSFDTVVAIYRGTSMSNRELLTCNDDFRGPQARAFAEVTPGVAYVVQVGGFAGDSGDLHIAIKAGGTIVGTLSNHSGGLIQGVCVRAFDSAGAIASTQTASDGTYAFRGLLPGSHRLQFDTCGGNEYFGEWYHDATSFATARTVEVRQGLTLTANESLARYGVVRGLVTAVDGDPVSECLALYHADGTFAASTGMLGDGTYSVTGLDTGSYRVHFKDCGYATEQEETANYVEYGTTMSAWYGGSSFATATPVAVTFDHVTEGIDAILSRRPNADITLTDLHVTDTMAAGDQHVAAVMRDIRFTLTNLGDRATSASGYATACPVTIGLCSTPRPAEPVTLAPGQHADVVLHWSRPAAIGGFTIFAQLTAEEDTNYANNSEQIHYEAVTSATGLGVDVCPGYTANC